MTLFRVVIASILSFSVLPAYAANRPQSSQNPNSTTTVLNLDNFMTRSEEKATGVSQLSARQKHELNLWLTAYTERLLHWALTKDRAAATNSNCNPAIESSIDGDFTGWDDGKIYRLMNGEIWEQVGPDYDYEYDYDPDVVIYSTAEGCTMKVDGVDETVVVQRIK